MMAPRLLVLFLLLTAPVYAGKQGANRGGGRLHACRSYAVCDREGPNEGGGSSSYSTRGIDTTQRRRR